MKKSAFVALATGLLLITLMVAQGSSQNRDTTNMAGKYEKMIDKCIDKCRQKTALLASNSPNVRQHAIRACLKGAYLHVHKKELVTYLLAVQVAPTQHRVEYHLNKRFYQSMKPDEMYVLLEASQMLNHSD